MGERDGIGAVHGEVVPSPGNMPEDKHFIDPRLYAYIASVSLHEPALLAQLREETSSYPNAQMQISPDQGQFLSLLIAATGAMRALEIGVFTGYSSLSVALALPAEGRLVACDLSDEYTRVARRYWKEAGVEQKIDLRLGPALESLEALIDEGQSESFDFAFIDADKVNYPHYFEFCLRLLRPGGLIAIDNVLQHGKVADPDNHDRTVELIRGFNQALYRDRRISLSLLPIADGITLALKR